MKIVIGIIGPIASGKDETAKYIAAGLKIPIFQISQPLREILRKRRLELSRENLVELGTKIAQQKGADYLAKLLLSQIKDVGIITGMRQLKQIDYLKQNSKLILLSVDAEPSVRFRRSKARNEVSEAETLREFIKKEQEENTGHHIQRLFECMKLADHTIKNNGKLSDLYKKIDKILNKERLINARRN